MSGVKKALPSATAEKSVSVRKIENGFIVSQSGTDGRGNWKNVEHFSPTDPLKATAAPAMQMKAVPAARRK